MVSKFDKIRQQVNSKLENQRIYGRTLAAIEETIQSQNEALTPMAYFGAIITTLDTMQEANEVSGALLYLLDEVMPEVSQPVLRAKFDVVLRTLQKVYEQYQTEQPVVRSYVGCMEALLAAQDGAAWSTLQVQNAYLQLLTLGATASPKARKRAQDAIRTILSRPLPPSTFHPASPVTADFVLRVLRQTSKNNQSDAQQTLAMLQTIVQYWPARCFTDLCETLLELPKLNNVFLTKAAFDVFDALFDIEDTDLESGKLATLLQILVNLKPAAVDERLLPSWLRMVSKAYTAFAKLNPDQCAQNVDFMFKLIFKDFKEPSNVFHQIAMCLCALARDCISDDLVARTVAGETTGLTNIVAVAEKGLGVHFQPAWTHVMVVQEALFLRLHRAAAPLMNSCLARLGDLRLSHVETYKEQLDKTLGAAITSMGPEQFLAILPLNLESASAVGRAFLLPLLKTYTSNTSLAYFVNVLIPLADRLAQEREAAANRELAMQAKVYETLVHQIWSLLPGFCDLPLDLSTTFNDELGGRLSSMMYSHPELRPTIATSLERLVARNKTLSQSDASNDQMRKLYGITQADAARNVEHMSTFAVRYLSVFFNVYGEIAPDTRGFLTETIRAYLEITPIDDVNSTFKKVIAMLSQALETDKGVVSNGTTPMSHTMLDLAIVMIPFLDEESANLLYSGTISTLLDKEEAPILQKKAYRILNILMQCPVGQKVATAHLETLQTKLEESVNSCTPSAKRERIQTLTHMVKLLSSADLYFIPAILSEVILATKEMNEKTRILAFNLLVDMGHKMKQGGMVLRNRRDAEDEDRVASLGEFFMMVTAGLAGSTARFVSASITCLARVFFEFKQDIIDDTTRDIAAELMETIFEFVKSKDREVVKASVGYVKVCVVIVPDHVLLAKLPGVIDALLTCSHQHRHFKVQIRHIFERLIRRCTFEVVEQHIPEEDKKLIANIQKRRLRAKRRKAANAAGDEEDEEDEGAALHRQSTNKMGTSNDAYEEVLYGSESEIEDSEDDEAQTQEQSAATQKKSKSKRKPLADTFIREDADADPLDFLDQAALGRISSAKPTARKVKKNLASSAGFANDMDGRLVIKDSDDEATKASSSGDEGENMYMLAQTTAEGFDRNQRNRIKFRKGGVDDAMEVDDETPGGGKRKKRATRYEKIGKEFRHKKAGGDVKSKNSVDPYAYVPLNKVVKKRKGRPENTRLTFTGRLKK